MSRHRFDLLMELDTPRIRLDCAALHLARDVYPTMSTSRYLGQLDDLANEVSSLTPGIAANLRYQALQEVLVRRHNLTGSRNEFLQPRGSYLNRVLDTGRGAPIALSIVWIEVARRLNWPVAGVAMPGHFIVRFDDPERFVLSDPFHHGRTLSLAACRAMVNESFDGRVPFTTDFLKPVNTRGILARLLKNLRNMYLTLNDLPRVAMTLRRMAAIEPRNGRHLQDLAAVCCRRGDMLGACAHLELYLRRRPEGREARMVRHNLKQLRAALLAMN